jgi:TolB-like protein
VALAAAAAKRLEADAVLILQLARRGGTLALTGQLVAVSSETTLGSSRVDVALKPEETLAESFAPAAHRLAGALAAHLSAARSVRSRPPLTPAAP